MEPCNPPLNRIPNLKASLSFTKVPYDVTILAIELFVFSTLIRCLRLDWWTIMATLCILQVSYKAPPFFRY